MVGLLNSQVLGLFLFYVVPGVIATWVYTTFIPSEQRKYGDYLVEVIVFSMFYLALFFWLIALIDSANVRSNAVLYNLLVVLTVFIIPAVIGWGGSALSRARWVRRLVGKISHPVPTAWDYVFASGKAYWIRFHLKTGEKLGGYYSTESFASAFPQAQEIYVQELWRLDDITGRFVEKTDRTAGGYIKVEDCKLIEFSSIQ